MATGVTIAVTQKMTREMRVPGKSADHRDMVLVYLAAASLRLAERGKLSLRRQLAVPKQVCDLLEAAAPGELLYRIATIGERIGLRHHAGYRRGIHHDPV
jgi:hypothetical protein